MMSAMGPMMGELLGGLGAGGAQGGTGGGMGGSLTGGARCCCKEMLDGGCNGCLVGVAAVD